MHRHRRARPSTALAAGLALLVLPLQASAAPTGDLTFQRTEPFSGSLSNGFPASTPQRVDAKRGAWAAGSSGGLYWCTPWPGTHIQAATVHAYRYHTASTTARVEVGPNRDGSGGYSLPDRAIPPGADVGVTFTLNPLNAECVGARARQTGADADTPDRLWIFQLQGPLTLVDDQEPAVDRLQLSLPQSGSWYTGPITAIWNHSDNDFFRGSTGVQVGGAPPLDLGDRPNGEVSATIDPGPDGTQTLQVYRTGERWAPAVQSAQITVDRTPPSPPMLVSTPSGTPLPVAVLAGGSLDAVSELAGYQYSFDGGANVSTAPPVFFVPGVYNVIARAVDKAGNIGAWTAPLSVSVVAAVPPPLATPAAPLAPAATAASQPSLPDLSGATLGLSYRSDALRPGGVALVDYDVPATIGGKLTGAQGSGLAGVGVVLRDGRGRDLARTTTDGEGGFALAFRGHRNGRLVIGALGQPELSAAVALRVRPLLEVRPARMGSSQGVRVVVPSSGRTIVLRGSVRPRALARGKRVQLQFLDGQGEWQPGPAEARVDRHGRFALRYRFGQAGRAIEGLARVTVPADTGWPFATAEGVPLRVSVPAE